MQLNNFIANLYSNKGNYGKVVSVTSYYDNKIVVNEDNEYFIDGVKVEQSFKNLEEAKQYIDMQEEAANIKISLYEKSFNINIAALIKKHYEDIKITNQLIETYIQTASSRCFTIDPIILEMRQQNNLDSEIDGKIVFVLNDGKQIAISEETIEKITNILNNSDLRDKTIDYMRESRENFLSVMRLL